MAPMALTKEGIGKILSQIKDTKKNAPLCQTPPDSVVRSLATPMRAQLDREPPNLGDLASASEHALAASSNKEEAARHLVSVLKKTAKDQHHHQHHC